MRLPMIALLALLSTYGPAAAQDAPRQNLFISPMGEPFRGPEDSSPEQDWFKGTDKNGDGKLTAVEMTDDATRFFGLLDLNADGEIDPRENERYEVQLVPEVSMRVGEWREEGGDYSFSGGPTPQRRYRHGSVAAQFSYIDIAQPIMSADTSFNRGVSLAEFQRAARSRFQLLDSNADGKLEQGELPTPKRKKARKR